VDENWFETGRGVVFPWHCDHFGHMNVRWYAHVFDDAGFHLWTAAGMSQERLRAAGAGVVVARIAIDYRRELRAGELFVIRSAFTRLGNRSVTHLARMTNADSGELCATQETVEVFFDFDARRATDMPAAVRAFLAGRIATLDAAARA